MHDFFSIPVPSLLLLGPTGSGKSPLGDAVARMGFFGIKAHHLDFGAELRAAASGSKAASGYTDAEIEFIKGVLDRGLLLENEYFGLAEKIIKEFMERQGFRDGHILVLNGIPRHIGQARDMERICHIRAVVALDCPPEGVICRLKSNIGRDRTGRVDDNIELVAKKLELFRERTAPLILHYELKGTRIYRIEVAPDMTPGAVYDRLISLASLDPPVSLVAEPPEG